MVYGRAIRPPRAGAKLLSLDEAAARNLPGVVAVVRDGSFLAVAATRQEQAIAAMQSIKGRARWSDDAPRPPNGSDLPDLPAGGPAKEANAESNRRRRAGRRCDDLYRLSGASALVGEDCALTAWLRTSFGDPAYWEMR
jgi:hypothetical protein